MPGILFCNDNSVRLNWKILQHEPWLTFENINAPFFLGRLSNNIFNNSKAASNERWTALIDGEFWNRGELSCKYLQVEEAPACDQELILRILKSEVKFDQFLRDADGSFFVAIYDKKLNEITFANDRFGFRPHYFCKKDSLFVLGSEVKWCLQHPKVSREIDMQSISEYFRFQCILEDRTFFKEVSVYPHSAIMKVDLETGTYNLKRYWDFTELDKAQNIKFNEAVEVGATLFKCIIKGMVKDNFRKGVYLSGGLDSRLIIGSILSDRYKIHTFTFGIRNCRDQVYAKKISKVKNTIHHQYFFYNGKWIENIAEKDMSLVEGFLSLFHAHPFYKAEETKEYIDVNLSGILGDALVGGNYMASNVRDSSDIMEICSKMEAYYRNNFGIAFTETSDFTGFKKRIEPFRADSSFINVCKQGMGMVCPEDRLYILFRNRKMLQYFLVATRPYFEDRAPFSSYKLVSFLSTLPREFRRNRKLQIALLDYICPNLSYIPSERYNKVPTNFFFPQLEHLIKNTIDRFSNKTIGRPLFSPKVQRYQDYAGWIRNDLSEWIKGILLDDRCLDRGIFEPDFVRRILKNHIENEDNSFKSTHKIGSMLSFEVMMREMERI